MSTLNHNPAPSEITQNYGHHHVPEVRDRDDTQNPHPAVN